MEILKVKKTENGWLVNDSISVPNNEGNRHYKMVQDWIADGGVVEPQYTDEELAKQELDNKLAEAKAYLDSTDFKMTSDYDQDITEIKVLRAEARVFIRSNTNG